MKTHAPHILAGVIALSIAAALTPARAETIYGINGANQLVSFDSANPNSLLTTVNISGATILNIDIRPATGVLYGLSDTNSLYTLDLSGTATLVGAVAISGGFDYGFDFNPFVDRLRIVTDTGTNDNYRVIPTTGALVGGVPDGNLNYNAGDPNFGANPNAVGAAYTNNFPGAPSTRLYYLDSDLDSLATTTNPNGGVIDTIANLGAGDFTGLVGFDISGPTGIAYASLSLDGTSSQLYTINLTNGVAAAVGGIGSVAGDTILDIAAPVPEPTAALLGGFGMLALLGRRRRTA